MTYIENGTRNIQVSKGFTRITMSRELSSGVSLLPESPSKMPRCAERLKVRLAAQHCISTFLHLIFLLYSRLARSDHCRFSGACVGTHHKCNSKQFPVRTVAIDFSFLYSRRRVAPSGNSSILSPFDLIFEGSWNCTLPQSSEDGRSLYSHQTKETTRLHPQKRN